MRFPSLFLLRQALIVKKSDGGFNYAATDLAAVKQRANTEGADRVLYVVDVGQGDHFEQVFVYVYMDIGGLYTGCLCILVYIYACLYLCIKLNIYI